MSPRPPTQDTDTAPRKAAFRADRVPGSVELGIGDQRAFEGDHIAYFWESDAEFEQAVQFLAAGVRNGDHCVIFGHDDANVRVRQLLSATCDCDALEKSAQLSIIRGDRSGEAMLATIASDFVASLGRGTKMLRLLGNIGWGKPDWPEENAILEFEARVTGAVQDLPAVVMCMYDVRSVPGSVMLHGGFETHPITIRRNLLRENPHYVKMKDFLASLQKP